MKRYKCEFCDYETNERSRIHIHHIVPREAGGNNNRLNLVMLCPNHHNQIFSDKSTNGIHTIKDDSITITGWYMSTAGWVLGYIDGSGQEKFTRLNK